LILKYHKTIRCLFINSISQSRICAYAHTFCYIKLLNKINNQEIKQNCIYLFYFVVIAIDIDPNKIKMARHNAEIYGVEHKIEFITGDFLKIAPTLKADVVFLSPPWGGPNYKKGKQFDMNIILEPIGGMGLYNIAARISQNVAYYLPKNADRFQVSF